MAAIGILIIAAALRESTTSLPFDQTAILGRPSRECQALRLDQARPDHQSLASHTITAPGEASLTGIDSLAAALGTLDELLDEDLLEPDPARRDWGEVEPRLGLVEQNVRRDVLPAVDAALGEAGDADTPVRIRRGTAERLASAAALLGAAGRAMA